MNKKVLVFWLVVIGGLTGTVFLSLYAGSVAHKEQNITLKLDVEPGVFYRNGDHFSISANPFGPVSFSYTIQSKALGQYKYLKFSGAKADSLYQVSLKIMQGRKTLFNGDFLQADDFVVELPELSFVEYESSVPMELQISVNSKRDLGLHTTVNKDMGFDGLFLSSDSIVSRWYYVKAWMSNSAEYQLSSLNFWQKQSLFPQLALGLAVWLTVVLLLAWFQSLPIQQVMYLWLMVLLPTSAYFVVSQYRLKQQTIIDYPRPNTNKDINELDRKVHDFTAEFVDWIDQAEPHEFAVFIKASDAFIKSRMRYHLHGVLTYDYVYWSDASAFKKVNHLDEVYLITTRNILPDCQSSKKSYIPKHIKTVLSNDQFCVVKL
ncbi:hypothetical protein [Marinicella rhabdoformis]|uniref:hypothetical protein n=1 Tax=Marinicella rhabdoformis TaxID=2580566 RepID=UPI0012AEBE07|nr:hypothetical protein [Marinicella rhabdoformis]